MRRLLMINLGGTSTKLAIFEDEVLQTEETFRHSDEEIASLPTNVEQIQFRKKVILDWFNGSGIALEDIDAIAARIEGLRSCKNSGVYRIDENLRKEGYKFYELHSPVSAHPSFLLLPLLDEVLAGYDIPIFTVDPGFVDEFEDVAYVSGHPDFHRISSFHVLNHKAIAKQASKDLAKGYSETRLVVAHMGGGVSIAAHKYGRTVDSTSGGSAGEGSFATNRTGPLPLGQLIERCYSGKYTKKEMNLMVMTGGGFLAHTGCTDLREIERLAQGGDAHMDLIIRAFISQVCKSIGAMFTVLDCEADAIVLTGGMAYSDFVVAGIKSKVRCLAPILVYPGEKETEAMISGALSVLKGEVQAVNA